MSGYDPVAIRLQPAIHRLHHETFRGVPPTLAFSDLCAAIKVPTELRSRLLRMLVIEGYVTEEGSQVRLTEAGTTLATRTRSSPTGGVRRS